MPTISSIIKLHDGMTPALQSINRAMNIVLNSFESMQRVSGKAIDTESIKLARGELAKAKLGLDKIEQDINQNTVAQGRFNNSVKNGSGAMSSLVNQVKMLVGAYVGIQSIGGIINTADELTQTSARLNLMNDGLQTTAELEDKIYQSAMRAGAGFTQTADAVAKLGLRAGKIFKSNDETIAFTETLNKMFVIAGASQAEMSSATLQLTQALGAGVLRGEEFNAVFEAAPNVMQAVADYIGEPIGALKKLASEGKISAEIVKNALFAATDQVNEQFESMPKTWGQVWTTVKNYTIKATRPILTAISKITSNERFIRFANGVGNAISYMSGVIQNVGAVIAPILANIFDMVANIGNFFSDNWSLIAPIVWGIVAAFTAYKAVTLTCAIVTGILAAATAVKSFFDTVAAAKAALLTGATFAQTAAQYGLNAALLACPITWIILGVIALIAVFYLAVAAVNKFAGTSYSATGLICGYFMMLGTNIYNIFVTVWNHIAAFVNFFGNVFSNPIYSVKKLFVDMAVNILNLIESITKGWDECATNLVNAMLDAVNGVLKGWNWLVEKLGVVGEKIGIGKATMFEHRTSITSDISNAKANLQSWLGEAPAGYKEYAKTIEHKDVASAFTKGYDWGSEKATQLENFVSGKKFKELSGSEELQKLLDKYGAGNVDKYGNVTGQDGLNDIGKALSGALGDNPALDAIKKGVGDIAGNTGDISKSLNTTEEDLSYMRDLREREALNRHQLMNIKIDMTNNNNIKSGLDVNAFMEQVQAALYEGVTAAAEGVHF